MILKDFITKHPGATLDLMTPGGYVHLTPEKAQALLNGESVEGHPGTSEYAMGILTDELLPQTIHSANYSNGVWHMLTAHDQPKSQEAEQQIAAGVRKQEIQSRLREKLDKGMDAIQEDWWQKTPSVLVGIAGEIAATQKAYNELYGGGYCDRHLDELEHLLRFENPLEVVRDEYIRQDTPRQYIMEITLWELKQSQSVEKKYALDGDWNPTGMGQEVTM